MRLTFARRMGALLALFLASAIACPAAESTTPPLPRIRVADDGRGFVTADGRPWVPFGVNYYRPGTGWAPQVWKQFDADAVRRDFKKLRGLGATCVRVFLTYGSFLQEPGVLHPEGWAKLDQFLTLAEEQGLYVHPTGPDHWEGLPEWARADRISDPQVLDALEAFWTELATRLRHRSVVFAYDLLNEPEVPWDTRPLRQRWNQWLTDRYHTQSELTNAWKRSDSPALGQIPPPPEEDALLDPRLLDFQRFREDLAEDWTRRQAAAIRRADPQALVTVGLIQWSVPVVLAHVRHYSGFRPSRQAPHLDFLSFHFYPLAEGAYRYGGAEEEQQNLIYLETLAREHARWGKPVVIGEFGWYGGGLPRSFGQGSPASEEDQARWCRQVVTRTRGLVQGWLNWGFHDQPEATDVSQFTGLLRADGTPKAWAGQFEMLARDLAANPPHRPVLDPQDAVVSDLDRHWDRLITSRAEVDAFRRHLYRVASPP
jgi:beta-galactosidase GanA